MIVVKFQGGLGNQLFQLCLLLKLKEIYPEKNFEVDINSCMHNEHNGFELGKYVNYPKNKIIKKSDFKIITEYNYNDYDFNKELKFYFEGYWQDRKYLFPMFPFYNYLFSDLELDLENKRALADIKINNSVSIHVRRGDYVNNPLHGVIATKQYFNNSIAYIKKVVKSIKWYVFSDDIDWCKNNLDIHGEKAIFVDWNIKNNAIFDIYLMSHCKHNILSNSSFSWWAQEFNKNKDKIVVKPEYWFNEKIKSNSLFDSINGKSVSNFRIFDSEPKDPFFSILIPVFNVENYLRRCLTSVVNQSFENIEVICVDDGSTDSSLKILEHFKKLDKRIKIIIHEKNLSLIRARQSAVKYASGQYILFLDSDDYLVEDACQILFNFISTNTPDVLEYEYFRQPGANLSKIPIGYKPENRLEDLLKKGNPYPYTLWNKAYKGELIKKAYFAMNSFYANVAEDVYQSIIIAFYAKTCEFIKIPLVNYYTESGMTSQKKRSTEWARNVLMSYHAVITNTKLFFKKNTCEYLSKISNLESNILKDAINYYVFPNISNSSKLKIFRILYRDFGIRNVNKEITAVFKVRFLNFLEKAFVKAPKKLKTKILNSLIRFKKH